MSSPDRLRGALVAVALLVATSARAHGQEPPPAQPDPQESPRAQPPPTAEFVVLKHAAGELAGFTLEADPESTGWVLVTEAGELKTIPPKISVKQTSSESRPVTQIASAALVDGLSHADQGVRERCQELLLQQGPAAGKALGAGLAADLPEARRRTLDVLAIFPVKELATRVRSRLGDGDERVRQSAVAAFVALKPEDAVARVSSALREDRSILVRHEAIVQLGRIGDESVVDLLLERLASDDANLRPILFDSLRRITGRNFGRDEEKWREWWADHRPKAAPDSSPSADPASPRSGDHR